MITAEGLIQSIEIDDGGSNTTKLATVVELFASGKPKLKFDGEELPSEKEYEGLGSYGAIVGDRVLLLGTSGTWVILGKIGIPDVEIPDMNFQDMVVDGYFRHTGGPDAETGVSFFGKPPSRQRQTSALPSNATTSEIITKVNWLRTFLRDFGFIA